METYKLNMHTKLQIGTTGTNPTFTDIPRLSNIPAISRKMQKIEVTHNQSTQREYVPNGLQDPFDYSFEMETDRTDSAHQALYAMLESGETRPFRQIYPDGLAFQFEASVLGITRAEYDPKTPDVIKDTVDLAITGDVQDISDDLLS